jgi:hypothetical protein
MRALAVKLATLSITAMISAGRRLESEARKSASPAGAVPVCSPGHLCTTAAIEKQ